MKDWQEKEVCVSPKHADYRSRVKEQHCGRKPLCWEGDKGEGVMKKRTPLLAGRPDYEHTATAFLSYGDWVGKSIHLWDSTGLNECVMGCKAFLKSIEEAADRGWCEPDRAFLSGKKSGLRLKDKLRDLAKIITETRTPSVTRACSTSTSTSASKTSLMWPRRWVGM